MIVFTATLKAKAGSEKKVEGILKGMIPPVQNEKGTVRYILHRSQAEPSVFMFYEAYTDQSALDFHNATAYFKQLGKDLGGLLDGEPKQVFYETVAAITR
jgi:quinol monooxygenase YgiN